MEYSTTGKFITKDGHRMFAYDVVKDIKALQRKIEENEAFFDRREGTFRDSMGKYNKDDQSTVQCVASMWYDIEIYKELLGRCRDYFIDKNLGKIHPPNKTIREELISEIEQMQEEE